MPPIAGFARVFEMRAQANPMIHPPATDPPRFERGVVESRGTVMLTRDRTIATHP